MGAEYMRLLISASFPFALRAALRADVGDPGNRHLCEPIQTVTATLAWVEHREDELVVGHREGGIRPVEAMKHRVNFWACLASISSMERRVTSLGVA
jgi:hypothetical protein